MLTLSIIIISYNSREVLLKCLDSIDQSILDNKYIELIIVDNNSLDGSKEAIKNYLFKNKYIKKEFIFNDKNMGFGAANNKGIRQARGEYLLLLNSDVILENNTLKKQIQFMNEQEQYAVSTCKLLLNNGKMDPACHRGFPTPWASLSYFTKLEKLFPKTKLFGQYHQGWKNVDTQHAVEAISGAFLMSRKEVFKKVGLFDEGFFMYGEDLDLCLRIKNAGFRIGFNSENIALHLKGQSGRKKEHTNDQTIITRKIDYHFWHAMRLFYQKHYGQKYSRVFNYFIYKVLDWKINQYVQ